MESLTYTREEMDYIKKTLDIVNRDLRKIYNLSSQKHFFLKFKLTEEKEYLLCIGPKQIAIGHIDRPYRENELKDMFINNKNFENYTNCLRLEAGIYRTLKGEKKYYTAPLHVARSEDADVVIRFLAKYEGIRKEFINIVESRHEEKEQLLESLRDLRQKYGGEVLVDLGPSQTQNMRKIELSEENGKKIGTIDFGKRLVKIITEGDIILTRIEKVKEKIKQ